MSSSPLTGLLDGLSCGLLLFRLCAGCVATGGGSEEVHVALLVLVVSAGEEACGRPGDSCSGAAQRSVEVEGVDGVEEDVGVGVGVGAEASQWRRRS